MLRLGSSLNQYFQKVFLTRFPDPTSEIYFQARVLGILHLSISVFMPSILFITESERLLDILIIGIVLLSAISLILLRYGYVKLVTLIGYTGMGLLATAIAFVNDSFQGYEVYLLVASHMFIILVSTLITEQKRYTTFTTFLALVYILLHMVFRAIPVGGPLGLFDPDDYIVSLLLVSLTGYIMASSLKRRRELLQIAQEEARKYEAKNKELAIHLKENEILLNEIHHRVKNNLNVAISLLRMQMDRSSDSPAAVEAFQDSINRLHSMALVHERLYSGGNFAAIEFKPYITSILHHILRSSRNSKVDFKIEVEEGLSVDLDRAVPCGLILNELIANIFKHAYPKDQSGQAEIRMQIDDDQIRLVVQDFGVGVESEKWFDSPSLGVRVVKLLVEQLDASIEVSGNGGTKIEISLPKISL